MSQACAGISGLHVGVRRCGGMSTGGALARAGARFRRLEWRDVDRRPAIDCRWAQIAGAGVRCTSSSRPGISRWPFGS